MIFNFRMSCPITVRPCPCGHVTVTLGQVTLHLTHDDLATLADGVFRALQGLAADESGAASRRH
jgi:hypothetical protein